MCDTHRTSSQGLATVIVGWLATAPLQAATARGETTFFTDDTHLDAHGLEVCAEALLAWEPIRSWLTPPR